MQQSNERSETSGNSPANSDSAGDQTNTNTKVGVGAIQEEQPKRLSLAELFAEDGDGEGHGSEGGSGDDDPSKPVDSIDGLTKRHKMTAEQVYAIKVPMPNGGANHWADEGPSWRAC